MQRSAAGTDENEFGLDVAVLTAFFVTDPHPPQLPVTEQILYSAEKANGEPLLVAEGIEKIPGEGAVVHVRTCRHTRRRNVLAWITAFHHQRDALPDLLLIVGIFHAVIKVIGGERLEAFFEKRDILRSAHKTEVGYGMNERPWVLDSSRLHQISPKLTRKIELGVDLLGL